MTAPSIPIHTRFVMDDKRYIITGFKVIGCMCKSHQYECRCISGPLTRQWIPEAEIQALLDEQKEVTA